MIHTYFFNKFSIYFFSFLLIVTTNVTGQLLQDPKRVIFFKETAVAMSYLTDTAIERFTPKLADIDLADSILTDYFLSIKLNQNKHLKPKDYFTQYVGTLINGSKYIFINAACYETESFLKNTYGPKGGGQGYFKTLIDIENKKVLKFYFNAPK